MDYILETLDRSQPRLSNSEIPAETKVNHVTPDKRIRLTFEVYISISRCLNRTNVHDVEVGNVSLVKQHPYRVNPIRL